MRARDIPVDQEGALGLCRLLLRAADPSEPARCAADPTRRRGVWERFDRWLADARQRERERYLAGARDVFELETRIRRLERRPYY